MCVEVLDSNKGEVIIAPFDVYVDETSNAVQPEIIVVLNQSSQIIDPRGHIHGVPDILIEVLSPNNRDHDQVLKKSLYERFGVKEYWIIDPETRLTLVYEWAKNSYSLAAEDTGLIRSRLLATILLSSISGG